MGVLTHNPTLFAEQMTDIDNKHKVSVERLDATYGDFEALVKSGSFSGQETGAANQKFANAVNKAKTDVTNFKEEFKKGLNTSRDNFVQASEANLRNVQNS